MSNPSTTGSIPEARLNELLRHVDWRFLLRQTGTPRALDLSSGDTSEALRLVTEPAPDGPGEADLAVTGFPTRRNLRAAREALCPGGEVVCLWRAPRPLGLQRARAALGRAGFGGQSIHWPGPSPYAPAEFWLPLGAPGVVEHVLDHRPAPTRLKAAMRPLWRLAERAGALAPVCAIARKPGGSPESVDEISRVLPAPEPWVLMATGSESTNKVVALPFAGAESAPEMVVKVARHPDSDISIEKEAEVLAAVARTWPGLEGIPSLRAAGRRCGRSANVQDAIYGHKVSVVLTPQNFPELAARVTDWLIELVGNPSPAPPARPAEFIAGALDQFERCFAALLEPETSGRMRRLLGELGELPAVIEHRDLTPWNVVLTATDGVGVVDWETASTQGLPGLDLAFFLATAAVLVEKITRNPAAEPNPTMNCQRRLLDPATETGAVAAACVDRYCDRVGIEPETFARLRLLGWIVQSVAYRDPEQSEASCRSDPSAFHAWAFVGAAEDEARRLSEGR